MTTLPITYTSSNAPGPLLVTILDTGEDLLLFHLDYGMQEDADGYVQIDGGSEDLKVPLKGLYRLQALHNGVPAPGPGWLLTKEQFDCGFTEYNEPYPTSPLAIQDLGYHHVSLSGTPSTHRGPG